MSWTPFMCFNLFLQWLHWPSTVLVQAPVTGSTKFLSWITTRCCYGGCTGMFGIPFYNAKPSVWIMEPGLIFSSIIHKRVPADWSGIFSKKTSIGVLVHAAKNSPLWYLSLCWISSLLQLYRQPPLLDLQSYRSSEWVPTSTCLKVWIPLYYSFFTKSSKT